jgi:hypothetical protein
MLANRLPAVSNAFLSLPSVRKKSSREGVGNILEVFPLCVRVLAMLRLPDFPLTPGEDFAEIWKANTGGAESGPIVVEVPGVCPTAILDATPSFVVLESQRAACRCSDQLVPFHFVCIRSQWMPFSFEEA